MRNTHEKLREALVIESNRNNLPANQSLSHKFEINTHHLDKQNLITHNTKLNIAISFRILNLDPTITFNVM